MINVLSLCEFVKKGCLRFEYLQSNLQQAFGNVIKRLRAKIIRFKVQMEEKECIYFIQDVYATDPSNSVKLNKVYQETITTNIAELLIINA